MKSNRRVYVWCHCVWVWVCARCKHMEMNNDIVLKVYGKFIGIRLYERECECVCSFCYFYFLFFLRLHHHSILLFFAFNIRIYTNTCVYINFHHLHYACDIIYFFCHWNCYLLLIICHLFCCQKLSRHTESSGVRAYKGGFGSFGGQQWSKCEFDLFHLTK